MKDFPDDARMKKISEGLWKAATMSADELAAKKGDDDLFVRIKRNNERLNGCDGHEFEPEPDWRSKGLMLRQTVHCRRCGGDMKTHDAMTYLRGFAHGSKQDFKTLTDAVWPPRSGEREAGR